MADAVRIGDLRHRITIETLTLTNDGQGGSQESWSTFATVWAKVEPKSSKERYFSDQIQYQRTHVITIRWIDGITNTMRATFKGRTFQIHGSRIPDEKRFFILLDCEENQGT